MVNISKTLEEIRGARTHGQHWERLIQVLRQLETLGPNDQQGRTWAKVVAELSGYSVNQIRQMQRTLTTLEKLQSRDKQLNLQSLLASLPFSHLGHLEK